MSTEADFVRIVRLHKRWADGYTLLTLLLILVLFTGTYVLYDQAGMDAAERTGALVLMGTIILATAIWQAVGLALRVCTCCSREWIWKLGRSAAVSRQQVNNSQSGSRA